jgi:PhnB protein
MPSRLNPYITFPGTAKEAMEFYEGVFGGTLTVSTFGEFGAQEAPMRDQIMHAMLESPNGFTLMASDTPPGSDHTPGTNISISVSGDDEGELRGYWDQLSEGGTISMALEKQMWGDVFGSCVDRFGISWLVNIAQSEG